MRGGNAPLGSNFLKTESNKRRQEKNRWEHSLEEANVKMPGFSNQEEIRKKSSRLSEKLTSKKR